MGKLGAPLDAAASNTAKPPPGGSALVADDAAAAKTAWGFQPVRLIVICGIILIGAVIAATAGLLANLRNHALADSERELTRLSLVLAEEIDRSFQSVELVQTAVIERMEALGIASAEEYRQRMSSYDIHQDLEHRISALPHINAIVLTDTEGKLINFSRSWPAPNVIIPENDPSEKFRSNPHLSFLVGEPGRGPVTGGWLIPVARKFTGPNGEFLGVVIGVIDAQRIEESFKAVTNNLGDSIALFRRDGTLLARYPHPEQAIGQSFSRSSVFANLLSQADRGTVRQIGAIDGKERLISARILKHYAIVVVPTTTVANALANWKRGAFVIVGVALMAGFTIGGAVAFTAWLVGKNLREQNLRWKAALDNMSQGLCMFDAKKRLIVCNKRYAGLYGLTDEQTKSGTPLRAILEYRIASGSAPEDHVNYIGDRLAEVTLNKPYQIINHLRDDRYISVVHRPMANGGWVATHEDVTEQKRAEQRIVRLAHFDILTALPNRASFNETIAATLGHAAATGERFAVLSIDLDHFKEANDTYGHLVGDAVLREVAGRLQAAAGGAFLSRLGGDEFALIVANGAQPAAAAALGERLLAALTADFEIEGRHLKLGMSMGVAIYPTDGADAKILMTNADAALYRAKAEARGTALFFEPEMSQQLHERRIMREDLRAAIDRGELRLHYQPQKKMSGETVGFEALVRWQCPKRGMVSPDTFISIAEESGLIVPLGEWVLREACREAASWPRPLTIAVNISPVQFRHNELTRLVHSILLETGLAPSRLELEVTESVFIDDFSRALSILNRLKSLGVQIAMDDFGTGYSSLSYLHSFPFDKIKIDRAFIGDLESNHHSREIVHAIIGLCRNLGLLTLAEGVETEAQHALLAEQGCDEVQGYLTGRPLPIADYAELVGRETKTQQNYAAAG